MIKNQKKKEKKQDRLSPDFKECPIQINLKQGIMEIVIIQEEKNNIIEIIELQELDLKVWGIKKTIINLEKMKIKYEEINMELDRKYEERKRQKK